MTPWANPPCSQRYRALSVEVDSGYLRFWIGSHSDYDRFIQ
jgi:hypothetical protein